MLAFWDASAIVPLCVQQPSSEAAQTLLQRHQPVVWWATPAEVRSAIERLLRTGFLNAPDYLIAGDHLEQLRQGWREVRPTDALRTRAEAFLASFPLKAADALQLAAAWVWCSGDVSGRLFISADKQLLGAASLLGFQTVYLKP